MPFLNNRRRQRLPRHAEEEDEQLPDDHEEDSKEPTTPSSATLSPSSVLLYVDVPPETEEKDASSRSPPTPPTTATTNVSVADVWREVTWYPVVVPSSHSPSSSSRPHRRGVPRRWTAVQGHVKGSPPTTMTTTTTTNTAATTTDSEDTVSFPMSSRTTTRPLVRQADALAAGAPWKAAAWTPLVARVRDTAVCLDMHNTDTNITNTPTLPVWTAENAHVTLDAWVWPPTTGTTISPTSSSSSASTTIRSPRFRQRSVTVIPERIENALDIFPGAAVVRVVWTGSLGSGGMDSTHNNNNNDNDDDNPIAVVTLRPKRYNARGERRPSPRPQERTMLTKADNVFRLTTTDSNDTHEIALYPPSQSSAADEYVTLMFTFRQVRTWLVETEGQLPRVVSSSGLHPYATTCLLASPSSLCNYSEQDHLTEYKRLLAAFYLEKRQDVTAATSRAATSSFLIPPPTGTQPCLARRLHHGSGLADDRSVASTTGSLASLASYASRVSATAVSSPIHNISFIDETEREDSHHGMHREDLTAADEGTVGGQGSAVALLVVDLQNDFLGDDPSFNFCRMTHKESPLAGARRVRLLHRIGELAQQVRDQKGVVVFCRSVYGRWSQSAHTLETSSSTTETAATSIATSTMATGATPTHTVQRPNLPISPSTDSHLSTSTLSSPTNRRAGTHVNKTSICSVGTEGSAFYPGAAALIQPQDVVITKQWYSAFLETSLHARLQRMGVQTVVVCGVTTNHSVSATVRSAANLGYQVIVSSDGTAQIDPSLQAETEARLQAYAAILPPQLALADIFTPGPATPRSLVPQQQQGGTRDRLNFDGWNRLSAIGSGDSFLLPDLLAPDRATEMLQVLQPSQAKCELQWKVCQAYGEPCAQATAYQFGRDEQGHAAHCQWSSLSNDAVQASDWSATVDEVRTTVQAQAGHALNWVRVLSHEAVTDTTTTTTRVPFVSNLILDRQEQSSVALVVLGDDLVLELRPKPGTAAVAATAQRIALRHNSVVLLGTETLRLFQYRLRCSTRASRDAPRLSLTFRACTTFCVWPEQQPPQDGGGIYGPGTRYPTREDAAASRQQRRWRQGASLLCGVASAWAARQAVTTTTRPVGALAVTAPLVGWAAVSYWVRQRRQHHRAHEQARLQQMAVRCTWQPLGFDEARALFQQASDEELLGSACLPRASDLPHLVPLES
jgi:nicotinamidase-related amidase